MNFAQIINGRQSFQMTTRIDVFASSPMKFRFSLEPLINHCQKKSVRCSQTLRQVNDAEVYRLPDVGI